MGDEKTNASTNEDSANLGTAGHGVSARSQAVPQKPSKGVFLPLIFGGAVAALLGFLGSELGLIGGKTDELRTTLQAQHERIAALEELDKPTFDTSVIDTLRSDVDARLSAISEELSSVQERIAALEDRPIIDAEGGLDAQAYANELAALQKSVEEQRNEINTLLENARSIEEATAEAARVASAQAALVRIISALDAGQPYDEPLKELRQAGLPVPDALAQNAAGGVATLASLQEDFPDAARAALAAYRSGATGDEKPSGFTAILKQQLGARSIVPREGNDPDAILSRAEAAVRTGDLQGALEEISALPAVAKDALGEWFARAKSRSDAKSAASELSQSLTTY